jgi:hypothetical protein
MTVAIAEPGVREPISRAGSDELGGAKSIARVPAGSWPATRASRDEVLARLTHPPFVLAGAGSQNHRVRGVRLLLDWLSDQPGDSWQQRWAASRADAAAAGWRRIPADWLDQQGQFNPSRHAALCAAVTVAIAADVIRPSLAWLVAAGTRSMTVVHARDAEGFAQLRDLCDNDPQVSARARDHALHRGALIIAAKGGALSDITIGDIVELLDAEARIHRQPRTHGADFYRMLRRMGVFGPAAPHRLGELRSSGRRTPEELIDRYQLACRPVRDLLVAYLKERQSGLDYSSLRKLAAYLGNLFWKDLERHHPGIDSLHLPADVAEAWKKRLRTMSKTIDTDGEQHTVTAERISYRQCLTPVRAFYLDLAQWAIEDPARWAGWVAPCPIGDEEINQRKLARHRKARMDARTRERLPALPELVRSVAERRATAETILRAAGQARPGENFTAAGQTLTRSILTRATDRIWADDPTTGQRRDLTTEEDIAFWAWAVVEVLRATGIRVEELLEISHHSMVRYRLPTTGELVPLLQIVPSKTDEERLLVVSPELADVLSAIIGRVRGGTGAIPLVPAYDRRECVWQAPSPWLFQRRFGGEQRRMSDSAVRNILNTALAHTGLTDPDGRPLRYTPHDLRRIFITDTIMSGLPPHIAQIIAGHRDINVTLGYKAVYPDEAIQAHLAFLARRRALRPSEEYRVPTDEEWAEFLGHFERRKVSIGTCGRAFGTPCIHEHACVRCALLWPDPAQRPRLLEIRDNLTARIAEAEREGWLGEIEGLQVSLAAAENKLSQIDKRSPETTVDLGTPTLPTDS